MRRQNASKALSEIPPKMRSELRDFPNSASDGLGAAVGIDVVVMARADEIGRRCLSFQDNTCELLLRGRGYLESKSVEF